MKQMYTFQFKMYLIVTHRSIEGISLPPTERERKQIHLREKKQMTRKISLD